LEKVRAGLLSIPGLSALGIDLLIACGPAAEPVNPQSPAEASETIALIDETVARGLDYRNRSGRASKPTILEAGGAGVALIDLQSDGDLDLVFAQGCESPAAWLRGEGADLEIFLNDGRGHFSHAPGAGLNGWWTGLATGDVDADGDADLVAGGFGGLVLLLQNEAGELVPTRDLAAELGWSGLVIGGTGSGAGAPDWVTSLALFDADRDGRLDLYVGRYLDLELSPDVPDATGAPGDAGEEIRAQTCLWKGHAVYCGPRGLKPQSDRLLIGEGDGGFRDESALRLPEHAAGYTLAVLPFDADGDGDADLAVACDSSANRLLVNDGGGRFSDFGWEAGIALGSEGQVEAGMGLAAGDVDRDGRLDLALTNFSDEPTALFLAADRGFVNATFRAGLGRESTRLLSWGVHLVDFDGDGHLELFSANGHVYPQADEPATGTSYAQADTLWRLEQGQRVQRVNPGPGSVLALATVSRGSAVGDLDGDGAPDLVLTTLDGPAVLGMNRGSGTHRLEVRCSAPVESAPDAGPPGPRTCVDAIGTRVVVVVVEDGVEVGLLAEVGTSVGYQSASSPWLHFGLGRARDYSALIVQWPSGRSERMPGGVAGRRLFLQEGSGIVGEEGLRR
jgi:hypothetical protein